MSGKDAAGVLNEFCATTFKANSLWWKDLTTGKPKARNVGEMLMLIVSELSEALEGHRRNLVDDKLPNRTMFEVEMADALIRIFDMCGGLGVDLGGAFVEKMAYNATRHDHTKEGRLGASPTNESSPCHTTKRRRQKRPETSCLKVL